MTKNQYFLLLYLFLYIFVLLRPSNTLANWIKNEDPIFIPSSNGWDSQDVTSPFIIKEGSTYKLWYHSYYEQSSYIGYGTSIDSINWQKNTEPVLSPSTDNGLIETNVETPTIVRTDKYYMWYLSYNYSLANYNIHLATSENGISWTKYPEPVLVPTEPWENRGVTDPTVIYRNGKFEMFYGAWGVFPWQIGYAESPDGIHWTKGTHNPLPLPNPGNINGPSVIYLDGKYHLFYHAGATMPVRIYHTSSEDLIHWQCEEGCNILSADGTGFDSQMVAGPSVLKAGNKLMMYYGAYDGATWTIGLATELLEEEKPKIVIIPGLMASWNKQAIIYNDSVGYSDWQLNPIVKDYNGLFATLDNLGLQENTDYFVFNYDWRKNIDAIVEDLNQYLHANNLTIQSFSLVGHSLGGLIARIYSQKYGTENLNKIVTLGSPHRGAPQVYKALAAGELDESDDLCWLAEKLILQLYRHGLENDREIIKTNLSIFSDLLPTYQYLYNQQGQVINYDQYLFQNHFLPSYSDLTALDSLLNSLVGEKGDTLYGYKLGVRTNLDKLLGNYPEGRPRESLLQIGDYIVSSFSASTTNSEILPLDHGELMHKSAGIKKILDKLELAYEDEQIQEGKSTQIFPSLFFLVMSPIELEVTIGDQTYHENNGLLLIENPIEGNYLLKAKGKAQGKYSILIGNLIKNNDQWLEINGSIDSETPENEIDEYYIKLDAGQLNANKNLLLDQILLDLRTINSILNNGQLTVAIGFLEKAKQYSANSNKLKISLQKAHQYIFQALRMVPEEYKDDLLIDVDSLEVLYKNSDFYYHPRLFFKFLKTEYRVLELLYQLKLKILLNKQKFGYNVSQKARFLNLANSKLSLAKNALDNKSFNASKIYLLSAKYLLKFL